MTQDVDSLVAEITELRIQMETLSVELSELVEQWVVEEPAFSMQAADLVVLIFRSKLGYMASLFRVAVLANMQLRHAIAAGDGATCP